MNTFRTYDSEKIAKGRAAEVNSLGKDVTAKVLSSENIGNDPCYLCDPCPKTVEFEGKDILDPEVQKIMNDGAFNEEDDW